MTTNVSDRYGRRASYIRVSVTDRCNLRCRYCMPENVRFIPHDAILRYEEIERLVSIAARMGVTKVRLTGGEPFVRKGFTGFLRRMHEAHPELDLRVTTNGTLLMPHLDEVVAAGVRCLNVSLDTLNPSRFRDITGVEAQGDVLAAVDRAIELGIRVKINAVALRGVNDAELPAFVELARTRPVDLRFIEFMPIGEAPHWSPDRLWPASEIIEEAGHHARLTPVRGDEDSKGPVRLFSIEGGLGRVGVISPMSNHFCATCNRLRITSTGRLRTCLYSDREYRLRPLLAHPRLGDEAVERVIRLAGMEKPLGFEMLQRMQGGAVCSTRMSAIGG